MSSTIDLLHQQEKILELVKNEPSHRNYWNAYKRIKNISFDQISIPKQKKVRIALMSSFTIDPLSAYLDVDCRLIGLFPEIYIGPFNQYNQEILDQQSGLFKFNPQIILFSIHAESLLDNLFRVNFPRMSTEEKQQEIKRLITNIDQMLSLLTQNTEALILFSNFVVPTSTPLGILDNKQEIGYRKFFRILNLELEDLTRSSSQIFIVDHNEIVSRHGKSNFKSYPMFYRGSILFNETCLSFISHEIMGYIKALKGKNRKAIVLDLDNTLWGGIIGEDELDGIKLNINYPGNDFLDFQKSILSFYNRGIILGVNSKNNLDDALEVFQKHPYMLIKEKQLASYRINWQDKVQNLIEISKELNIGLDSLVFFDDNPVERARIQESLPDVLVVDLPKIPALYRQTLEIMNDFNSLSLTKEDLKRGEMYFARRKRQDLEKNVQSMEDFIQSLELIVEIKLSESFSLPRITSLLNRTNQFNLTTKRYNETEVNNFHKKQENYRIYSIRVQDRFGDEGIVGVALIRIQTPQKWFIDSFLMSCRVIGRKIETTFLYKIIKDAKEQQAAILEGEYIPTKKNVLVKDFYSNHDFNCLETKENGYSLWQLKLSDVEISFPQYLTVKE
ncbi:MAG: HAD-IIIC family phosphatase [Candidatus Hodarchaeales archaeon]|jgi:FkbH-like protein